jgi:hypothetical protein
MEILLTPFENVFYFLLSLAMAVAVCADVNKYVDEFQQWDSYVDQVFWNLVVFCIAMYLWPVAIFLSTAGKAWRWFKDPRTWNIGG